MKQNKFQSVAIVTVIVCYIVAMVYFCIQFGVK